MKSRYTSVQNSPAGLPVLLSDTNYFQLQFCFDDLYGYEEIYSVTMNKQ